jgi:hypothetical protein
VGIDAPGTLIRSRFSGLAVNHILAVGTDEAGAAIPTAWSFSTLALDVKVILTPPCIIYFIGDSPYKIYRAPSE